MIDGALVVAHDVATARVLASDVTDELEARISLTDVGRTETRLRDYDQHLRIAVRTTASPYTIR